MKHFTTKELASRLGITPGQVTKAMEGIKPWGKQGHSFVWTSRQGRELANALGKRLRING